MATEIHPADDFTDGTEGSGGGGGVVSLVATAPLTFDAMTSTLAVMPAGAGSAGIVTTGAQTIAGAKTFSSAVSCAVAPSDSAHLANKGYIDGLVSMGVHWLANVNKFYDLSSGDPAGLADGKRYIASATAGDFVANHIYTYDAGDDSYADYTPLEGNAVYVQDDDSATYANQCIIFNGSSWVSIGSSINHQSLIGAGTLTHATIDSYLNQAVKTTSSPTFTSAILQSPSTADPDGYGRLSLWRYMTAGSTYEFIRVGKGTASYPYESNNGAYLGFSYGANSATTNYGRLGMAGAATDSLRFNTQRVTIPLTAADALTVTGGASIGGAITSGSTISAASSSGITLTADLSSSLTGSYARLSTPRNFIGLILNRVYSTGSQRWDTYIDSSNRLTFYNNTGDVTPLIIATTGDATFSGAITGGSTLSVPGDCGLTLLADATQGQAGTYAKFSSYYNPGVYFNRRYDDLDHKWELAQMPSNTIVLYNRTDGWYAWKVDSNGVFRPERGMSCTGNATFTGSLTTGGSIGFTAATGSGEDYYAGTYARLGIDALNVCVLLNHENAGGSHLWKMVIDRSSESLNFYYKTGGVLPLSLGIDGNATFTNRVTAANMTCSTAPSLPTDVVRLGDIDGWSPSGALHVTDDTESDTVLTGSITTLGGVGINKSLRVAGYVYSGGLSTLSANSETYYATKAISPGASTSHIVFGSELAADRCGVLSFGISSVGENYGNVGLSILGIANSGISINQAAVVIPATTATSGLDSGCLVALGGVAIGGALRVGGAIIGGSTISCTSITAPTISGNTSVSGNLSATGTIAATGAMSASNFSAQYSLNSSWGTIVTATSQTLYYQRIGNHIRLYTNSDISMMTTSDGVVNYASYMPEGYRPATTIWRPIYMLSNNWASGKLLVLYAFDVGYAV